MAIGWLTNVAEATTYYTTRAGASSVWSGLTTDQKTAALTTSYKSLYFSPQLSLPASPTAAQLEKLKYAQLEWALFFVVTDEGGLRRQAAQDQNISTAGVVKESYLDPEKRTILPKWLLGILSGFVTEKNFFSVDIYRDETVNPAWDTAYDTSDTT